MVKPDRGARAAAVDWEAARTLYVTTGLSLREVAREFGVTPRTVQRHSGPEGWAEQRARYRREASAKARALAEEERAAEISAHARDIREEETRLAFTLLAAMQAALDLATNQLATIAKAELPPELDDALAILELAAPVVAEIRKSTHAGSGSPTATADLVRSLQEIGSGGRVNVYQSLAGPGASDAS